jgi:hypothetical protein
VRLQFALLLVACGGRTDLGGVASSQTADASQPQKVQGALVNECAPNDGLANAYVLALPGATAIPTCTSSGVSAGSVHVSFWALPPSAPGDYTIGDGSFHSGSLGAYCPLAPGPCLTAAHGTFTLTEFTDTAASGQFTLVFPDQTTVSGEFSHIPRCNNSIMCG